MSSLPDEISSERRLFHSSRTSWPLKELFVLAKKGKGEIGSWGKMGRESQSHKRIEWIWTEGPMKTRYHLSFGLGMFHHTEKFGIRKMIPGVAPSLLSVQHLTEPYYN